MSDRDRAVAFLRETCRRHAEQVEDMPWGELFATPSLPRVWDANFALVTRWAGGPEELRRELDRRQAAAGFDHRRTVVYDEALRERLQPDLERLWSYASPYVLMAHRRAPDRAPDPAVEVLGVGDVDWARGRRAFMELEYGWDDETMRQLIDFDRRIGATTEVRRLAAVVDGEVVSYAALYLDGDVAQVEDVATLPQHRGRGLARAVVLHAVGEARRAGADLVFLVADATDWPQELYGRLGFDEIGGETVFGRPGRQHSVA